MSSDACGIDLLKEIDGHTEVDVTNTLDGKTYRVFAGIEHTVLAGAIILKEKQTVAVGQLVYVFGFSCVKQFLFHSGNLLLFSLF